MVSDRERSVGAAPPGEVNPYGVVPRSLRFVWQPVRGAAGARRLGLAALALVASPFAMAGALGVGVARHLAQMARLTRRELALARGDDGNDDLPASVVDELPPRERRAEHVDHR